MARFMYLALAATQVERGWRTADVLTFEVRNPNGLYAAKKDLDARIDAAVKAGKCPNGALVAYGSLNNYATEQLLGLLDKRHLRRRDLEAVRTMLRYDIARGEAFLAGLEEKA